MKKIKIQQIALAGVMLGFLTAIKFLDIVMIKTPLGYSWVEFYVPTLLIFAMILPFQISFLVAITAPFIWFALGQTMQVSPLSFFLDYMVPVLSMLLVYISRWTKGSKMKYVSVTLLILLSFLIKYFSHTLSGVVAWEVSWRASAAMNAPYVFVTMLVSMGFVWGILPKIEAIRGLVNKGGILW